VERAQVSVDHEVCAKIGRGLLVLLGVEKDDTDQDADFIARKVANMRIFEDEAGKMNRSVRDIEGAVLLVSQFTLLGDCRKGNRPSFTQSAQPEVAEPLFMKTCDLIRSEDLPVQTGVFGAMMDVELVNAGPVTIVLDSRKG
jgi:D-tyrosyl-tRNA(Tyr) deacylase